MRRGLLFTLLTCCFLFTKGQSKIDSLLHVLATQANDTHKVKTIYRLGAAYLDINQDSSWYYAHLALGQSRKLKFKKGEALVFGLQGSLFSNKGDYPAAFEKHIQALKIYEDISFESGIASSYNNMALVQVYQRDFKKATGNFLQAIKYYKRLNNNDYLLQALINIGDCYEKMDTLEAALSYLNEANELALRLNDQYYKGQILTNLGNLNARMGMPEVALGFYHASLPVLMRHGDKQFLSESYYGIAKILDDRGQIDSSIHYAYKSLSIAREYEYPQGVLSACKHLSNCYVKLQNTDSAFLYLQNASIIRDTLNDEGTIREVERLSIREQLRQEGIAAEKERLEHERKNNLQMLAIVIFLVSLFGLLTLWSKRKVRPRSLKYLGLIGLLMTFEFISIFLHPYIGKITHHTPVLMLLAFVSIAFLLVPLHHKMEHWVEEKLAHKRKRIYTSRKASVKQVTPAAASNEQKKSS